MYKLSDLLIHRYYLEDDTGESLGILCILKDITREYISRQHYQQALQMFFKLPADAYSVVLIDVEDWRIIAQRQQLVHENTLPVCAVIDEIRENMGYGMVDSLSEAAGFFREFSREKLQEDYQKGQVFRTLQYQWRFPNGEVRWIHNNIRYMMDMDYGHLCVVISGHDIDQQKKEEQELLLAAQTDQMTKVLNRGQPCAESGRF